MNCWEVFRAQLRLALYLSPIILVACLVFFLWSRRKEGKR